MKLLEIYERQEGIKVAPLVGAWIEILAIQLFRRCNLVAPLVGAWIEIATVREFKYSSVSLLL